jgi:hypothetical protein
VLATANLDHLPHEARLLNINGRSYRRRELEQPPGMQQHRPDALTRGAPSRGPPCSAKPGVT